MSSFIYNGREVYDAKDLKENFPVFFHGCADNTKSVVKKRSIPVDVILYAIKTSTGWNSSTPDIRRSSLLLDKKWVDKNMPKFLEEGITTPSGKTYLSAPDILELSDDEKLRDDEGNIYEIEVRGERCVDKCYFRASNVEILLKMKHIAGTLQRSVSDGEYVSFERGKHYQTFITDTVSSSETPRYKNQALFLTYAGLVQLLFVRKHPIAEKFRKWAVETLFTIKHGTPEAKETLAIKLLGVPSADVKAFLSVSATPMPVIYLFIIGKIGDLRKEMKIDKAATFKDSGLVAKFGYTIDLKRRTAEHEKTFSKFKGANIYLKCYSYVDPENLSEAESELRKYFEDEECLITDCEKFKELVVLNNKFVKHRIFDKFEAIGKVHAGCFATMKISEVKLKHSIDLLNTKLDERDARLAERDARLTEKHDIYVETNKRLIRAERLLDEKDAKIAELTELNNRLLIKR